MAGKSGKTNQTTEDPMQEMIRAMKALQTTVTGLDSQFKSTEEA